MIKVRKFYENEVTFSLRKIIDNEIRLQINVLVTKNLGKWLVTIWQVFNTQQIQTYSKLFLVIRWLFDIWKIMIMR